MRKTKPTKTYTFKYSPRYCVGDVTEGTLHFFDGETGCELTSHVANGMRAPRKVVQGKIEGYITLNPHLAHIIRVEVTPEHFDVPSVICKKRTYTIGQPTYTVVPMETR